MDNLKLWNAVKRPPASALKEIKGGRLSGMTDIKPQWRYQAMTELFGPCGTGWSYTIERLWTEPGCDGQVMAFAQVFVQYIKVDGTASAPIPGVGGSMLVTKEKAGLHTSDEGFKMAITDALSTALKVLGVGADIYSGMWDGTKYKEEVKPHVNITATQKKEFAEQVRTCLANGDDQGISALWAEWGADEKVVLWALFNSQERSAMKSMQASG